MIVKVEATAGGAVISTKDGEVLAHTVMTPPLRARMRGRARAYFKAYKNETSASLNLDDDVADPSW
jgi:hypothetical protein